MITIICGHYGCGKTNLAINLAVEEAENDKQVILVDMDIVNPYFRSGDYKEFLEQKGIEVITPNLLGTTTDTPSISATINKAFINNDKTVIIDLGGDDAGATAIGAFSEKIIDYQMFYVVNKNRIESSTINGAITLLKEIETACGLKVTAVINNTHLGVETTKEVLENSLDFAKDFANEVNLPLLYSTAPDFVECEGLKKIKRYVKFPWEL